MDDSSKRRPRDRELDAYVDSVFNEMILPDSKTSKKSSTNDYNVELMDSTRRETVELFEEILPQYLEEIRENVLKLARGQNTEFVRKSLLSIFNPLIQATEELEYAEMYEVLVFFKILIYEAEKEKQRVSYRFVQKLNKNYERFIELLSAETRAKITNELKYRGQSNQVIELLQKLDVVDQRTIQRLYETGMVEYNVLLNATPQEIHETTALDIGICTQIIKVVLDYAKVRNERRCKEINDLVQLIFMELEELRNEKSLTIILQTRDQFNKLEKSLRSYNDFTLKVAALANYRKRQKRRRPTKDNYQ